MEIKDKFQKFFSNCTEVKYLNQGGQKTVYKALHPKFGNVVVKVGKYYTDNSLNRIKREVEILDKHTLCGFPNYYLFMIDEDEKAFLMVEEFINAISYEKVKEFYCTEKLIIQLLYKLITCLKPLWNERIVHRDLKPQNILFRECYNPIIIDLGIARDLDGPSYTESVYSVGPCTPAYAAPEQLRNDKELIDMRTDFFALGIIVFELMYGFHPFDPEYINKGESKRQNILEGNIEIPNSKSISDNFICLIRKLLQSRQFKRFRDYNQIENYILRNWEV